ncbi:ABC transporter permease [Weissella confusa]|uniref:ABC transporter permease n=1 Tax=Weissella confusa TaxID=1583 RepID=UPI0035A33562
MSNLLRAEWLRTRYSRRWWLVFVVIAVLPVVQGWSLWQQGQSGGDIVQIIETVVNGATGVLAVKKNGLALLMLIMAAIAFMIGEEFQHGTIRNTLALGHSRTRYYLVKLGVAMVLSIMAAVILTAVTVGGYTLFFDFGHVAGFDSWWTFAWQSLLVEGLLVLANVAVYMMIAIIVRSVGPTLIVSFLYTLGTGFVPGLFAKFESLAFLQNWFVNKWLFYFNFADPKQTHDLPEIAIVALLTIVVSSVIGIFWFKKTDIK